MTEQRAEDLPVRYAGLEDVDRMPVTMVWEITLACDLACQPLRIARRPPSRDGLTTAEALDLVDQIAELGTHDIGLIGGEAYLRKDWLQIVAAVRAAGMTLRPADRRANLTEERVALPPPPGSGCGHFD